MTPGVSTQTTGTAVAEDGRQRLHARDLKLAYGERVVVDGLDVDVVDGTITAVIGPNGCGKSTLLRALGRLLQPQRGSVLLDGKRIHKMATKDVAKVLGLLPQSPQAPEGLTVADLVARGRHPHQSWYRQWSSDDEAAVAEALGMTGIEDLAERTVDELSGGQRQRAWLSMALAQGTDLLLLDEPTTYLDLSHQVDVLDLIGRLHDDSGRTVVMVLHDLNLAARYADRLVAMKDGAIVAEGAPGEVLTEELLAAVFGLKARVIDDPVVGTPMVVPVGGRRTANGR
ncbi:iron complex transport system ATP-binding protein [Saccharopolyspora erythraea NRRL 2338]|uniref:Fe(3+) enterobactin transport ATP-binding protein n=2 Tax=Saccharopolyspora erythraea TaxID=1836 RepID=A4F6T7_SACEN|nr:ABC transporter ATP-binding protein [Saccharopolyspora erythraea]EQD87292.1 ABC transporter ATP-binding protein [Saccharopolyspora erythraea D]PFG93564.1 iron complex transport system ATP-binding protein [Saccharopolyspora erythraea NRRL 2338]QRK90414.1 ABC transporter ATP-binding protein [Saccharopolyspora erythraea]CAL99761.1 Fe(3+) enterobactin transport ATP-binding protein [Saccharopolyspora erythraea NRRL 2338]